MFPLVARRRGPSFLILAALAGCLTFTLPAASQVLPETGGWWNPAQPGTGFFIERQGTSIFLLSFLYNASGQATWYLASGAMSGSTFTAPLNAYCCGETLTGSYQPDKSNGSVGTVSVTWTDPQDGTLTWPGGTIPIQRFSFTTTPPQPPQPGSPQTGLWWDPDESGVGYAMEFQGSDAFVLVFTYAADGSPTWYLVDASMTSPTLLQSQWMQYCCGQTLTGPYQPDQVVGSAGNMTMQFSSLISGTYTKPNGQQIPIERFQFSSSTPVLPVSVLTYHNDSRRTGQNTNETILTTANVNVNRFGKKASLPVDGQVYAQPLAVSGVNIGGVSRNVVYVATEHDSVYAFDADAQTSTPLWQRSFLNSGVTPAQSSDTEGVAPEIGVTGTPVIDPATHTLYLVAMTNETTSAGPFNNVYRLHALDLSSGAEKFGGPVVLLPTVQGTGYGSVNGQITIEPGCYQRPALLLQNGSVYVAWGHCNHGWIAAYNASTLAQQAVFNSSPNGKGASIWMGGGGPAGDANGNVYVMTGVDYDSTTTTGYSDSFLKLSPALQVLDYFMPSNNATLTANDQDLGSGGPMIPPDNSSATPQEIIGAGKDGRIFVANRNSLGGFGTTDNVVEEFQSGTQPIENFFDVPAYWNGLVFIHSESDVLRAYPYANGLLGTSPASSAAPVYGIHGATPAISSYGTRDGIVWELQVDLAPNGGPAVLHAYSAANVGVELYNSSQAGARDVAGPAVKFAVPTVANGKVYVGTGNQLDIYGQL